MGPKTEPSGRGGCEAGSSPARNRKEWDKG